MPNHTHPFLCDRCGQKLPTALCNCAGPVACPGCGLSLWLLVFPALLRPVAVGRCGEALQTEGEAGCFYHADRRAVVACEECGRFLCALCEVPLAGRRLCPACIAVGQRKGSLDNLHQHRVLYDEVALALTVYPAVVPFFGWALCVFSAPAGLFIALRHWRTPLSVVPRRRWRFVVAIVLASLEILAGIGLALFLVKKALR